MEFPINIYCSLRNEEFQVIWVTITAKSEKLEGEILVTLRCLVRKKYREESIKNFIYKSAINFIFNNMGFSLCFAIRWYLLFILFSSVWSIFRNLKYIDINCQDILHLIIAVGMNYLFFLKRVLFSQIYIQI